MPKKPSNDPLTTELMAIETRNTEFSANDKSDLGVESEEKLTLWAAIRKWPKIVGYSLALCTNIILWGFDFALVGSVAGMPVFLKVYGTNHDGEDIITSTWLAMWNIGGPIGVMLGSLLAGWMGDRIGRKRMLALSTIATAIGVAIFLVSDTPPNYNGRCGLFLVARIIQGIAIGSITTTVQVYMSEVVPQQLRGSIMPFFPVFQLVGQILGAVVVQTQMETPGRMSYKIPYVTQFAFGLMPFILACVLPESPVWLLRKGRPEEAMAAHKKLQSNKKRPSDHISTFARLRTTITHETHQSMADENAKYALCFKQPNLRRTVLVALVNCLPETIGGHLMGSAGYFLQRHGIGLSASTANIFFIIGIAIGLVANVLSLYVLSRVGRRIIILVTSGFVTVIWAVIGVVGSIQKEGPAVRWFTPIGMMAVVAVAGIGVWPASYVVAAETSSLHLRARTSGIGWFVNGFVSCAFGMSMPYVYNDDAGRLGAQSVFVYAGVGLLVWIACFFYLPEMRGRSQEEIDRMFEMRLPARDFKRWPNEAIPYTMVGHGVSSSDVEG